MATQVKENITNGVNVDNLTRTVDALDLDPSLAKTRFHITNKWIRGGHNRSTITSYFSAGREHYHKQSFDLDADKPDLLAGTDEGAIPTEHLLHALAGCLTTSMVYHAAIHGIVIEEVESELEGDLDLRGFTGLSKDIRKGYEKIQVHFKVKTDPKNLPRLRELIEFSPVYDVVRHGTPVEVRIDAK
jgi:uncharacterized OsmC-like protein